MSPGTTLFVNEREMSKCAGVCRKTVRTGLRSLDRNGLIEFKGGQRHKHYGIAGQIRRIIPIPKKERNNEEC